MSEWSSGTFLFLLPTWNCIWSMQGTGNPPLCHLSIQGEGFSRTISGCFSPPLPVWRTHQRSQNGTGSVHCLLSSDLQSFAREGFLPSRGQQPGCQLRANRVGKIRHPQSLPVLPVSPPWRNWFANTRAPCAQWKVGRTSGAARTQTALLCVLQPSPTSTFLLLDAEGFYLQLPNYRSATACVSPQMRKWGHMAFVIRDLCELSVQQRCNFLYKSIYKTKHV